MPRLPQWREHRHGRPLEKRIGWERRSSDKSPRANSSICHGLPPPRLPGWGDVWGTVPGNSAAATDRTHVKSSLAMDDSGSLRSPTSYKIPIGNADSTTWVGCGGSTPHRVGFRPKVTTPGGSAPRGAPPACAGRSEFSPPGRAALGWGRSTLGLAVHPRAPAARLLPDIAFVLMK